MEDGAKRIFISAEGDKDDVSDDMKNFLQYLTDQSTDSALTRRLEEEVQKAKSRREWSVEYMTLYEKMQMEREAGIKEGLDKGLREGRISDLLDIVKDGLIPYDVAAKRAEQKYHIKEEDFRKMLDSYDSSPE